jgi:hypothetical protein
MSPKVVSVCKYMAGVVALTSFILSVYAACMFAGIGQHWVSGLLAAIRGLV